MAQLRDWSGATILDGTGARTFGHRWDDPQGEYRALYTSSSLVGALVERLQDLQPTPSQMKLLDQIAVEPGEMAPAYGVLSPSYFDNVYLCEMQTTGRGTFLDIEDARVLAHLRREHADLAAQFDLQGVTLAAVYTEHTELTRAFARTAYDLGYAGICATSKIGTPHENWTLFETGLNTQALRADFRQLTAQPLRDLPCFDAALGLLNLQLGDDAALRYKAPAIARAPSLRL